MKEEGSGKLSFSPRSESDGERCVWGETASVFPVYLPCVQTQSQLDRPNKKAGYCRDQVRQSPKILMKGCSVEWPRTLNSSDRHRENSRVLNLSSSTASDSLVLQIKLNRFIVTLATLCQNHFWYLIIAEKGEGLLTFLQQQQLLALESNVCDSKHSPSLPLASIKQGNQKSSAAQRRNSTVS